MPLIFTGQKRTKVGVAETADAEFTAQKRAEELRIVTVEEIESGPTATFFPDRTGDFVEVLVVGGEIVNGGKCIEVAAVALSDHVSRAAGFGYAGDPADEGMYGPLLESLGLTRSVVSGLLEGVGEFRDEMREFLTLLKGL